jgi:glyceraldehyde 3-phosphate dehydrogenase
MRVGINGMGRIGRLALRAAMGAVDRPSEDPHKANRFRLFTSTNSRAGPQPPHTCLPLTASRGVGA